MIARSAPATSRRSSRACAAPDKQLAVIAGARHYFEPEPGERESPHVELAMDRIVPWIQERFS